MSSGNNIQDMLEFGDNLRKNYIPTKNNQVPNEFIQHISNMNTQELFEHFGINVKEEYQNNANVEAQIEKELMFSLYNQISIINGDFYNKSLDRNSFIDLEKIILALGFEEITTFHYAMIEKFNQEDAGFYIDSIEDNPIHADFTQEGNHIQGAFKDRNIYYYHKDLGLLWEVQTQYDHFVSISILYGNVIKKSVRQADLEKMASYRLEYSNIFGFAIDMNILPIYKFEKLLTNYNFLNKWLILPYPDFRKCKVFQAAHFNNIKLPKEILGYIVESFSQKENKNSSAQLYLDYIATTTKTEQVHLLMVDLLFNGYSHPEYFKDFFVKKERIFETHEVYAIVYKHFKYFHSPEGVNLKTVLNDDSLISFLELFDKKHLKTMVKNKDIFVNALKISDFVWAYIENRLLNKNRH